MAFTVGVPEEWQNFENRHVGFLRTVLPPLLDAATQVFVRRMESEQGHERLAFMLGRHVPEDFREIFLLCGNGFGIGALKLLRGMYERVVTMTYLLHHPERAKDFADQHLIEKQKFVNHLRADRDDPASYFGDAELTEIAEAAKRIRDRLPKDSWTDLDLKSMARVVGLDGYYTMFYYWPTLHTHSTAMGMAVRIDLTKDGISFKEGPQRGDAEDAANGTINRELAVLGRLLRLAHEHDQLARVPRIRRLTEAAPRAGFVEASEFEAIRRRLPVDLQAAVTIAFTYG